MIEIVDERAHPSMRERLGTLLSTSRTACIAIAQLRIAGLNLSSQEMSSLERCRILLGRVDAAALLDAPTSLEPAQIARLTAFAASGHLEIRTAPLHVWHPDFSVFHSRDGQPTTLVGAHYFERPYPLFGLAVTCVSQSQEAGRLCEARFEQIWEAAYDVLPIVLDALEKVSR